MRLMLRQRHFAKRSTFDIFDENWDIKYYALRGIDRSLEYYWYYNSRARRNSLYRIWLYDGKTGRTLGSIRQKPTSVFVFELELEGQKLGEIRKDRTVFTNNYYVDCREWDAMGKAFGRKYEVTYGTYPIMTIHKTFGRHIYNLDIEDTEDEVVGILLTLAIDSVKRL